MSILRNKDESLPEFTKRLLKWQAREKARQARERTAEPTYIEKARQRALKERLMYGLKGRPAQEKE